jgi:hypothetical protein
MPERGDQGALGNGFLRSFFARNANSQSGTEEADNTVGSRDDQAQNDALAEGETPGALGR